MESLLKNMIITVWISFIIHALISSFQYSYNKFTCWLHNHLLKQFLLTTSYSSYFFAQLLYIRAPCYFAHLIYVRACYSRYYFTFNTTSLLVIYCRWQWTLSIGLDLMQNEKHCVVMLLTFQIACLSWSYKKSFE